jgi:hypothetical protein
MFDVQCSTFITDFHGMLRNPNFAKNLLSQQQIQEVVSP